MNKLQLVAVAQSMGVATDDTWTVDALEAAILNHKGQSVVPTTVDDQHDNTVADATEADAIFRMSKSLASEILNCRILFVAPTSNVGKVRLIVTRDSGKTREIIYVFKEVWTVSGLKPGQAASLFVEKRHSEKDNKDYWNCTAIAGQ